MKIFKLFLFGIVMAFLVGSVWPTCVYAQGNKEPRVIVALYNGDGLEYPRFAQTHRYAEMPLNHLGLVVEHYDVRHVIPNIKDRKDVLGVLTWFSSGTKLDDPIKYLKWAEGVVDSGKKFVIVGDPGFRQDRHNKDTPIYLVNAFLAKLGLRDEDEWVNLTYNVNYIKKDLEIVDFERLLSRYIFPYERISVINKDVTSHLVVQEGNDERTRSDLIVTGPRGGYVADDYAFYYQEFAEGKPNHSRVGDVLEGQREIRMWHINPFAFFRKAFATDNLPIADTTTIAGRRIYYSHIDGDGWNNITNVEKYRNKDVLSSQVIMDDVIKKYPDLPITVAPIAAELDPKWAGIPEGIDVAKKLLALPQVEVGTHTFTHPYEWQFFEFYDRNKEEVINPNFRRFSRDAHPLYVKFASFLSKAESRLKGTAPLKRQSVYDVPRPYADKPFDINQEVAGSIKLIQSLIPKEKAVSILMWPGNTTPYEDAIKKTREANIVNINGGDSRYDREYPSYGWLASNGRIVGNELQVYASNSNENTYTDLWTGRFHGFRFLVDTVENTESPIRVKPFNIYYHMYSGERDASLLAVQDNMNYARKQEIAPIKASDFAKIVKGYFSVKFEKLAPQEWKVLERGDLQTIRFDRASMTGVDFSKSVGVIGERHYQGSLYIYLDKRVAEPIIALKALSSMIGNMIEERPYLISSRWLISGLSIKGESMRFSAEGYGKGEMKWCVPYGPGSYVVSVKTPGVRYNTIVKRQQDGTISFVLPQQIGTKLLDIEINGV